MTIRRIDGRREDPLRAIGRRGIASDPALAAQVAETIEAVRARGDAALLESARRFDAPDLAALRVTEEELEGAALPAAHHEAIRTSIARVRAFHAKQLQFLLSGREWRDAGVGQRYRPVAAAGVYVPGGRAAYPSSVIMNAVPAQVAGVERIVVTTPARADGSLAPAVLVALRELGIREVVKVGGAAAIAALALGTESLAAVDVVVGPGNRYVNEAKRQLWGSVGLDGYAGPSEVCVLADGSGPPDWAAIDLLTQVEHSDDNVGVLVTIGEAPMDPILAAAARLLENAPRRAILEKALADHGMAIVARDLDQAVEIVNAVAPEHLSLAIEDAESVATRITNAGCILIGHAPPESAGDFCAGPSHTLPTAGAARFGSPVNVLHFIKIQSLISLGLEELAPLRPVVEAFGEMEGFPAHGLGATLRGDPAPPNLPIR